MQELSMHILDIAENSVAADAKRVEIRIQKNQKKDILTIEIEDNGKGMDEAMQKQALDPFITTKPHKKVGLGLSMLAEAARKTGGKLHLHSEPGKGTRVHATFGLSHMDLQPMGDIVETMVLLIIGNQDVEFEYHHTIDEKGFAWDTGILQELYGELPKWLPEVVDFIRNDLRTKLHEIESDIL